MNKLMYVQLGAALAASLLLYQADWGLNALLMALIVLALLLWKGRLSLLPGLLFALAGLLVATTASGLSLSLYFLLLFLVVSLAHAPQSWVTATANGLLRLLTVGWQVMRRQQQAPLRGFSLGKSLLLVLPSLALTFIFYGLYANANPAFAQKASFVHLHLPDLGWCMLFLGLLYTSYGLVYELPVNKLQAWDARQPDELLRIRKKKFILNPLWLKYEYKAALLALVLLNGLLLLFHSIDLSMLVNGRPTEDLSYAEWVHQGVGTLILSILMAVALLIWVFRGNLNFFRKNGALKAAAKAWIMQNLLLVVTTALKNSWYIAAYGLTYKRIGVGVYLILVLLGLLTTWSKISHKQTLWWMIKKNYKAGLLVLLLSASLPWARIITWYNLEKAQVHDMAYLFTLPLHNTDQLLLRWSMLEPELQIRLDRRQKALLKETHTENWRSWTILNHYAQQNIEKTR